MSKPKEEYKGLGSGPGVDPIPEPDHPSAAATNMLEDVVDEMLNRDADKRKPKDRPAESDNNK
ncbi:hypothetical protein V3851_02110 [Paenibacillus sp. M1]|uniref:YfhD-like protein n=1 Tax=Paenibacillus haidiansis TaxID=1574488 RepID=A0ABU7VLK9_9BACL